MLKTFLWIIIAGLAGVLVWLLLAGEENFESAEEPTALRDTASDEPPASGRAPSNNEPPESSDDDTVVFKSGKTVKGRLISQSADVVDFRVFGSRDVSRFLRAEIASIRVGEALPKTKPRRTRERLPDLADEEEEPQPEKSELRMTAQEAKAYELKKRKERQEKYRKRPMGVRAINIARDLRDDLEKRNKQAGLEENGKEE